MRRAARRRLLRAFLSVSNPTYSLMVRARLIAIFYTNCAISKGSIPDAIAAAVSVRHNAGTGCRACLDPQEHQESVKKKLVETKDDRVAITQHLCEQYSLHQDRVADHS